MKNRGKNPPKPFPLPSSPLWEGCLMAWELCDEHRGHMAQLPTTKVSPHQHLPRPGCSHRAGAAPCPDNNKAPSPQPPPCLWAPRIQVTAWATWEGHHKALQQGVQIKSLLLPSTLFSFNMTSQVSLCFSLPSYVIIQSFNPRTITKKNIIKTQQKPETFVVINFTLLF